MMRAIDLFAGWGGFSLGATRAGVDVVWAANHWRIAVDVHARNHPLTEHACQDLHQADWTTLPRFDLLLASPACQGHSPASQPRRRPKHDADRSSAWAVVDCADATEPTAIIVENVPRLRAWRLYSQWLEALRALGYHVAEHLLDASRCGVPQRRRRLFVTATRRPVAIAGPDLAEVPFSTCLDDAAGGWRPVSSAPPASRARIEAGRARFGRRQFLSQSVTGHRGTSLDGPINTITTKNQWRLVDGDVYRVVTERELARGQALPDTFSWPAELPRNVVIKGIGNAVPPPMATYVVRAVMEAA